MSAANIAFAQSPPGIGRKRPSLPGQLPGDRASAVPLQLSQMRPVVWVRTPLNHRFLGLSQFPAGALTKLQWMGNFPTGGPNEKCNDSFWLCAQCLGLLTGNRAH
jgi:hypothetical protein